jgi:uncharacterized RDD family membrane protein YckC
MNESAQNPFAPPMAESDPRRGFDQLVDGEQILAERGQRLGAAIIDGLLAWVALGPALYRALKDGALTSAASGGMASQYWFVSSDLLGMALVAPWLAFMGLQAYLITTGGQSVGKRVVGTQLVRTDGSPVGFVHGVILHTWAIALISYIPSIGPTIGSLAVFVDVVMIFGSDRRCLHNRIADTKVIVKPKR